MASTKIPDEILVQVQKAQQKDNKAMLKFGKNKSQQEFVDEARDFFANELNLTDLDQILVKDRYGIYGLNKKEISKRDIHYPRITAYLNNTNLIDYNPYIEKLVDKKDTIVAKIYLTKIIDVGYDNDWPAWMKGKLETRLAALIKSNPEESDLKEKLEKRFGKDFIATVLRRYASTM